MKKENQDNGTKRKKELQQHFLQKKHNRQLKPWRLKQTKSHARKNQHEKKEMKEKVMSKVKKKRMIEKMTGRTEC